MFQVFAATISAPFLAWNAEPARDRPRTRHRAAMARAPMFANTAYARKSACGRYRSIKLSGGGSAEGIVIRAAGDRPRERFRLISRKADR